MKRVNMDIYKFISLLCLFSLNASAMGQSHSQSQAQQYGNTLVTVYRDIAYGPDQAHKFDVYTREGLSHAPVIFMVHGGAWKLGDKESKNVIQNKIERWLPAGFVFVSINYRLLPRVKGPVEQAKDVRNALVEVQKQAANWGADPEKVILMGHSAGAHLVGLIAGSVDKHIGMGGRFWLGSILLDSAALDVPSIMNAQHYGFYDDAFGSDPEFWVKASPLHQLRSDASPILITCSIGRREACNQAQAYANEANSLGVRVSVISKDLSHKEMNSDLGADNDYTVDVESFMSSLDATVKLVISSQPPMLEEPKKGLIRRWIEKRQSSK